MTVSNPQLGDPMAVPPEILATEDEIDLRQYILLLFSWRREILMLAVVTALLAAAVVIGMRFLSAPVYEASATVAIARTINDINFDDRFQTSTNDNIGTSQRVDVLANTRRAALVGLVHNGAVAESVAASLADQLGEAALTPVALLNRIEGQVVTPEGSRNESDLILITARARTPELAASLANAWASAYVKQVNNLYGQVPASLLDSVRAELTSAQDAFDEAQRQLEIFIAENDVARLDRLIAEKADIINSLQVGKQTAIQTIVDEELQARRQIISAYINAQASNRLLAFNKEQSAKQTLISTLIDSEFDSRLLALQTEREARRRLFSQAVQAEIDNQVLAFNKDQDARARLFAQYVETEIENRLKALSEEQSAKTKLFDAYASADTRAKIAVFNQQVEARLQTLARNYDNKLKLERLATEATALRAQVAGGSEEASATNGLALLLLKAEAYGIGAGAPGNFQLSLDDLGIFDAGVEAQLADLDALLGVLADRIANLDEDIAEQSQMVFANEGYTMLDADRPEDDPLYTALQQKYLELFEVGDLAQAANGLEGTTLSQAIMARYEELFAVSDLTLTADSLWQDNELFDRVQAKYQELFGVGAMAMASMVVSDTTPLAATIEAQYPELFTVGDLSALTEQVVEGNALTLLGEERAKELLQLQGLEDLPAYTAAAAPLTQAIDTLEDEIQVLRAQREAEGARHDRLIRERDLALKTLTTLSNKNAEFHLADTAADSEVRFASPALPPLSPVPGFSPILATLLGVILGGMMGVILAFLANLMGVRPFLSKNQAPASGELLAVGR